jgi:transposase
MKVHSMREPVEIKPRRKFDPNFKRQAVSLWLESGRSARELAQELGVRANQLYRWKEQYRSTPTQPQSPAELQAEVAALRRENTLLRQQREVLKKTLGILSDPQSNATGGSMS